MKATKTKDHSPLPLARSSTGPIYDRPERARTSHACEPCRERKTKCDGERPSCRRCLHTGTGCHYGYGKGWRKRKTAEDLSVTSMKLQRYESLLTDILPMVNPEVRDMIEEVRGYEVAGSTTSETTESTTPLSAQPPQLDGDGRRNSLGTTRLPLPGPLSLLSHSPRTHAPPPLPFDQLSGSASPQQLHHPSLRKSSTDESTGSRLPSITANGMLIEHDERVRSAAFHQPSLPAPLLVRGQHLGTAPPPLLPEGPLYGGWSDGSTSADLNADSARRLGLEVSFSPCLNEKMMQENPLGYPSFSQHPSRQLTTSATAMSS